MIITAKEFLEKALEAGYTESVIKKVTEEVITSSPDFQGVVGIGNNFYVMLNIFHKQPLLNLFITSEKVANDMPELLANVLDVVELCKS